MKRILFVCTGNICRSPTAEGVARHLAREMGLTGFEFDSAGTHAYHTGEAPDMRAQKAARRRGYDLSGLRARTVMQEDFESFDLILAMDRGHLAWLQQICPEHLRHKLALFLKYSKMHANGEIEDPYYGGPAGFDRVLDQCEEAMREVFDQLG
ncbi:MAG: phosphotyrosine protein phosphatase [Proteobacteria bacterium]|nr:phosphotyrosine protein phosphatase [Pseudomonadota bacterium]